MYDFCIPWAPYTIIACLTWNREWETNATLNSYITYQVAANRKWETNVTLNSYITYQVAANRE